MNTRPRRPATTRGRSARATVPLRRSMGPAGIRPFPAGPSRLGRCLPRHGLRKPSPRRPAAGRTLYPVAERHAARPLSLRSCGSAHGLQSLKRPLYDWSAEEVTCRSDKSQGPTVETETADPAEFVAPILLQIPDVGHAPDQNACPVASITYVEIPKTAPGTEST